jgi:hypothetical protein
MTTCEPQARTTPADSRAMPVQARPEQIERLMTDIRTGVASDRPKGDA